MKTIRMMALTVFANAQIVNRHEDARRPDTVQTGDPFDAPWHVARDLAHAGLAKPVDHVDLAEEPIEDIEPHHAISAPDLHRANAARRQRAAGARPGDPLPAQPAPQAPAPGAITTESFKGPAPVAQPAPAPVAASSGVKSNAPAVPPAPAAA